MSDTPMPWDIPGAPQPGDYLTREPEDHVPGDKRPGTYVIPAHLAHGDKVALGANRDVATVVGSHVLPEDRVLLVLDVPAEALFRLEK